jgi:hypothetical protein
VSDSEVTFTSRSASPQAAKPCPNQMGELLSVAYPSWLFCSLVRLPRNRSPGPVHERLHLLQGKLAIFVAVHCLENSFVSRLKLLQ